jgi:segregation and condensation protein B
MSDNGTRDSIVEALILASPEPLPARRIADAAGGIAASGVAKAVAELNHRYLQSGSSYRIRELAGGYQFYIVPEYAGYVEELFTRRRKMRLTRAALETLAIIAYRQPVTKTDIEHIRGVASDGVVHNLLEKNMITITGRAESVGRPLVYGTTDEFLKYFGLNRLDDLPRMSEIEELIGTAEEPGQEARNFADGLPVPETAISPASADETEDDEIGQEEEEAGDSEAFQPSNGNGNGEAHSGATVDLDRIGKAE